MSKFQTEYMTECLVLEALADDQMIKTAQDHGGIVSSLAQNIKSYVLSKYDPDRPAASVVAFLGPGMLWKLGFPWMSVLYEVMGALGFNWIGFWDTVKNDIEIFVKTIISSGDNKPSDEELSQKVDEITNSSARSNMTGDMDIAKLTQIALKRTSFASDLHDTKLLKVFAESNSITKQAAFGSLKFKMIRFFIKIIKWVITTALISLGLSAGGGIISGLVHKKPFQRSTTPDQEYDPNGQNIQPQVHALKMNQNASPELFIIHRNDINDVWIEKSRIENIEQEILSWILNAYPQLASHKDDIENSSGFQSMLQKFYARNRMAEGIGLVSIPPPYQRKIDIVSEIVNRFMQQYGATLENQQAPQRNPHDIDVNYPAYQ